MVAPDLPEPASPEEYEKAARVLAVLADKAHARYELPDILRMIGYRE